MPYCAASRLILQDIKTHRNFSYLTFRRLIVILWRPAFSIFFTFAKVRILIFK